MSAPPKHRDAIVNAAVMLFRQRGFSATGINEISDVSGAPKGSLYHYFPEGKDQIGEAAVRLAGNRVSNTFKQLFDKHSSASSMVRAYGRLLAGWMSESDFRDGCPITTTLLEKAPASQPITTAGAEAFRSWCDIIRQALLRDGVSAAEARRMATLTVAALEGALVLARVECSAKPIHDVFDALAGSLDTDAVAKPLRRRRK
jgi:TetR/AcrR family transcriptional repressor of lmrAB and yxaGH operons